MKLTMAIKLTSVITQINLSTIFLHELLWENKCLGHVFAKAQREKLKYISNCGFKILREAMVIIGLLQP